MRLPFLPPRHIGSMCNFFQKKENIYYGLSFQTQNDRNVKVGSGGEEGLEVIQPNPLCSVRGQAAQSILPSPPLPHKQMPKNGWHGVWKEGSALQPDWATAEKQKPGRVPLGSSIPTPEKKNLPQLTRSGLISPSRPFSLGPSTMSQTGVGGGKHHF